MIVQVYIHAIDDYVDTVYPCSPYEFRDCRNGGNKRGNSEVKDVHRCYECKLYTGLTQGPTGVKWFEVKTTKRSKKREPISR